MKKKFGYKESRGLPGGPNEMFTYVTGVFSTEGYKANSPDVNNPFNIIPSGNITMEGVNFPVKGTDNLGNTKVMIPGNNYKFPGDIVFETPMAQDGEELFPGEGIYYQIPEYTFDYKRGFSYLPQYSKGGPLGVIESLSNLSSALTNYKNDPEPVQNSNTKYYYQNVRKPFLEYQEPEYISNIRNIQQQNNIPATGFLGDRTVDALLAQRGAQRSKENNTYVDSERYNKYQTLKQNWQNSIREVAKKHKRKLKPEDADLEGFKNTLSDKNQDLAWCISGVCTAIKEADSNAFKGKGDYNGIYFSNTRFEEQSQEAGWSPPYKGDAAAYDAQIGDIIQVLTKEQKRGEAEPKTERHAMLIIDVDDEGRYVVLDNQGGTNSRIRLFTPEELLKKFNINNKKLQRFSRVEFQDESGEVYKAGEFRQSGDNEVTKLKNELVVDNREAKASDFQSNEAKKRIDQTEASRRNRNAWKFYRGLAYDAEDVKGISAEDAKKLTELGTAIMMHESGYGGSDTKRYIGKKHLPHLVKWYRGIKEGERLDSPLSAGLSQIDPKYISPELRKKYFSKYAANTDKNNNKIERNLYRDEELSGRLTRDMLLERYNMLKNNPNLYGQDPEKFWYALAASWQNPGAAYKTYDPEKHGPSDVYKKGDNFLANWDLDYADSVFSYLPQYSNGGPLSSINIGDNTIYGVNNMEDYRTAYNEGRVLNYNKDGQLEKTLDPVIISADKETGKDYPFINKLSKEELRYINNKGPLGNYVRNLATTGVGVTADGVKDFAMAWLRDLPLASLQAPQSALVEGVEGLRGNEFNMLNAITPGQQRVPSDVWGFETTDDMSWYNPRVIGNFAMDMVTDPMNVVGAGVADDLLKLGLKQRLKQAGRYVPRQPPSSPNAVSVVDDISRVVADTPQPWQMQELPGLHLKSTMTEGPISKIVEPKTGLINTEQALAIIGKESGGADKVALIRQGLGDNIPKKMDYNEFRKLVQDQLIPLERQFVDHKSNYGINRLGYKEPEFITRTVDGKIMQEMTSDVIENQTLILGNKSKFGRGSSAHGNPDETLGHAHFLIDVETPDVLTVTQIQSDAFQGTHRIMPKDLNKTEKLEELRRLEKQRKELIKLKAFNAASQQEAYNQMLKNELENFTQKSLLDKNHQERYLQELVNYAGERGDINKIRVPTSETAAKVQGYTKQRINTNPDYINPLPENATEAQKKAFDKYIDDLRNNRKIDYIKEDYSLQHQTILKKYSEQPKTIKKLFGQEPTIVTDSKGNTWYEFDIPEKFKQGKGEIKAYQGGGELTVYKDYVNGLYDGTPKEDWAKQRYDKLNRIYYKSAKDAGMSVPNYIMSKLVVL